MKLAFSLIAFSMAMTACGTADSSKTAASNATWSNTAMQAIVANKCATVGCHSGTQTPNLATMSEADVKANAKVKLRMVTNKDMPPSGNTGLTPAELETAKLFFQ